MDEMALRPVVLGAASVIALACSATSSGTGGGAGGGPVCSKGTVRLEGTIGGESVQKEYPFKGVVLNQASTPKTVSVYFGSGGQITMQWSELLANGQTSAATGSIFFPSDGPLAGSNVCLGSGSTVTLLDDAGQLSVASPTTGTSCPGSATQGQLSGCWAKN
jgi:hypothetical protein